MAPRKRQTMLFSATFSEQVKQLMALSLKNPVRLAADVVGLAPKLLTQEIVRIKVRGSLSPSCLPDPIVAPSLHVFAMPILKCKHVPYMSSMPTQPPYLYFTPCSSILCNLRPFATCLMPSIRYLGQGHKLPLPQIACLTGDKSALPVFVVQGEAEGSKEAMLLALCSRSFKGGRTIIFFKTKQRAHKMKILFGLAGLPDAGKL